MCAFLLYALGIALAYAAGWWLRGLRDEHRREQRPAVRVKPKDYPYP